MIDITRRKSSERESARLEQQLLLAQKRESLGLLTGGIAHDFNNLLTGVMGFAELALSTLEKGSKVGSYILGIIKSAEKASELTHQMLAYSGKGRFLIQEVNLSSLTEEMLSLLHSVISRKAILQTAFLAEGPIIQADKSQITQVIMNLIINASEALGNTPGSISVETGILQADRQYLSTSYIDEKLAEGSYAFLRVTDNGCGMNAATLAKLFDPFFSTKFSGRGLGLAAVLGIVHGHKGAIRIDSKPMQGTKMEVLFPLSSELLVSQTPGTEESNMNKKTSATDQKKGTILLIDDEYEVRNVTRTALEARGFKVIEAIDGLKGIAIIHERLREIDLVLLDLIMPNLGGKEVLAQISVLNSDLKVVLMSGYSDQEMITFMNNKNLVNFLQKPFRIDALYRVVDEAIEGATL